MMAFSAATCKQCGKEFTYRVVTAQPERGQYCSLRCFHNHNTKYPLLPITCVNCGKVFTSNKQQARALATGRQKRAYCSPECARQHMSIKYSGEGGPNWKGGIVESRGYVYERENRHLVSPYVAQHRKVAEKMLGRLLRRDEVVHHINGNTKDNRFENLAVLTIREHMKLHTEQRERTNGRFIDGYSAAI